MSRWQKGLSKVVQELRWQYCQKGASSTGMREFVAKNYCETKEANPTLPILVRENIGIEPRLIARYDFGKELSVTVSGMSATEIEKKMEHLAQPPPS
eukprot:gb/GEZN01034739.1/.p1 GENE.gb/GEZN01034739.1/~~gb/GEZN01034739.1/.p1  ORF type:complete len:106 (-),score=12.95 gb/GEZN01034739.1/:70-360(-)